MRSGMKNKSSRAVFCSQETEGPFANLYWNTLGMETGTTLGGPKHVFNKVVCKAQIGHR